MLATSPKPSYAKPAMRKRPHCLYALLLLMPLAGCATSPSNTSTTTVTPGLSGNWQIQTGPTLNTSALVLLTGSLQTQGRVATGIFETYPLCGALPLPSVVNYTGTFDANRNLTLTATPTPIVSVQLAVPADPTTFSSGTIQATGQICNVALSTTAIGVEIPPVSGTFSGAVTAASAPPLPPPLITAGSVSLTLAQSTTPNTSGQFPLTGTIAFTGGSCTTASLPVTGTISGVGFNLTESTNPLTFPTVMVQGTTLLSGSSLQAAVVSFSNAPCATGALTGVYSGTLTRQ